MKRYSTYITIVAILFLSSNLYAAEYYGSLQITDPTSGISNIVFQTANSQQLCKALNENYWRGLKTSCPQCKLELSGCDTTLPSAYRYVFKDKPTVFPYVSAPYTRIIIFGGPLNTIKGICKNMAKRWQEGMNQKARCISK